MLKRYGSAVNHSLLFLAVLMFACHILWAGEAAPQQDNQPPYVPDSYRLPESRSALPPVADKEVRNVILLVGDGMGFAHVQAARLAAEGADGKLHMERLPVTGRVRTHSLKHLVTDSAAAATALSAGVKTVNGMIGVLPDGRRAISFMELAHGQNRATGIVATCSITHATPAAFGAHVEDRNNQTRVAEQLSESTLDLLFGGGWGYFVPDDAEESERRDEKDPLARFRTRGYTIALDRAQLAKVQGAPVVGLFDDEALETDNPAQPSLAEMTAKAIDILRRRQEGFVLMVEGSQIDWASHANDTPRMIREVLRFDMAVAAAVDFARRDMHTLVIVTADHETGGVTIDEGPLDGSGIDVDWETSQHTAADVPLFAWGPGAQAFAGELDNTEVARRIAALLGISSFPQVEDTPAGETNGAATLKSKTEKAAAGY